MAEDRIITKSLYCIGVQCPKKFWLKIHNPKLYDKYIVKNASTEEGIEVGKVARGLFGDFTLVEKENMSKMAQKTKTFITEGKKIIAEASFLCDGLFCSVDILKNLGEGKVELYEVKNKTSYSKEFLHDIAFQVFVLEKCGYTVNKAGLIHINNQYVRGKELEIDKLFTIMDLTNKVRKIQPEVQEKVDELKACILNPNEPDVAFRECCIPRDECFLCSSFSFHKTNSNEEMLSNIFKWIFHPRKRLRAFVYDTSILKVHFQNRKQHRKQRSSQAFTAAKLLIIFLVFVSFAKKSGEAGDFIRKSRTVKIEIWLIL